MQPTLTHRAQLAFNTNLGEVLRFAVPRARLDNTSDEAQASMQAMIAGGAIVGKNGVPGSIHGAQVISTQRNPIIIAV